MPSQRKLTPGQQERRIAAAAAKAAMEREALSLRRAAARYHVSGREVLATFPTSIGRDERGRYVARPDREAFLLRVILEGKGSVAIWTYSSAQRQLISRHFRAIEKYLDPRRHDLRPLRALTGSKIGRYVLETDPAAIRELFDAGELSFLELYYVLTEDE